MQQPSNTPNEISKPDVAEATRKDKPVTLQAAPRVLELGELEQVAGGVASSVVICPISVKGW